MIKFLLAQYIYCNLYKNLQHSSCKGSFVPTIILTGGNYESSYKKRNDIFKFKNFLFFIKNI